MCLNLTNTSRQETADLIKRTKKSGKPLVAYKVFKRYTTKNNLHNDLYSPYRDTLFTNGINESNRTKNEIKYREIIEKIGVSYEYLSRSEFRDTRKEYAFNSHFKNQFKRAITKEESAFGINLGFHAFITLTEAEQNKDRLAKKSSTRYTIHSGKLIEKTDSIFIVLPVEISYQDIVMIGAWTDSSLFISSSISFYPHEHNSIVCTKLTIDFETLKL